MKLKSVLILYLAIFYVISCPAQVASSSTWAATKAAKSGNISIIYYKMSGLIDLKDGKPMGVCADIMSAFGQYLQKKNISLKIDYKNGYDSFNDFYGQIKKSKAGTFGLGNLTITAERKHEIMFSKPFMTNVAFLVTNKQSPTLKSLPSVGQQFENYTAYVAKGTTHERLVNTLKSRLLPNLKIEFCQSSRVTIEKVAANPQSFCYADLVLYLDATQNKKLGVRRQSCGDRFGETFGVMMPLESDWVPIFNTFLDIYIQSLEFQKSLTANLGADATKIINIYAIN